MSISITRRRTIVSGSAFICLSTTPVVAQLSQDVKVAEGDPSTNYTLADCDALDLAKAEISARISAVNGMTDLQLLNRLTEITEDLNATASKRAAAVEATQAAIAASASDIEAKSVDAVRLANDLQLATAVQTRNPQLVGAAAGAHVLIGTGVFAYQAIQATSSSGITNAGVIIAEDRMAMMTIISSGPGRELAKKQVELAFRLFVVGGQITKGIIDLAAFKSELRGMKKALDALKASVAGLPATAEDTRAYFRSHLETERLIYDLLQSVYGADNCTVPGGGTVIPLG